MSSEPPTLLEVHYSKTPAVPGADILRYFRGAQIGCLLGFEGAQNFFRGAKLNFFTNDVDIAPGLNIRRKKMN